MDRTTLVTLVVMVAATVLAPILYTVLSRFVRVPVAVLEMFLGILIGPSVLGLAVVTPGGLVDWLRVMGVVALFFLAGQETNFKKLMGRPLRTATTSWLLCLVIAVGAMFALASVVDFGGSTSAFVTAVFIGGAVVSTAIGTIYPMMNDAQEITTKVGQATIAAGVIGQFAPLVAVALIVGDVSGDHSPLWATLMHLAFCAIIAVLLWLLRGGLPFVFRRIQSMTMDASGQFGIRLQVLVVGAVVLLAVAMGVDRLIGAFAAGILVQAMNKKTSPAEQHILFRKAKALGYGFLIPLFFVWAGVTFDLAGLVASPQALWFLPVFVILKFLARGVPGSLTLPKGSTLQERTATSLLVGTGLAVVVVMGHLGLEAGAFSTPYAAAMVGGAKVTALVFPTIGLMLANRARGFDPAKAVTAETAVDDDGPVPAPER
ncbi:cation:proton antiporter [Xylanimonas protaetiae]|uniref:Cation:proton antiporter n=1 Tax=Xylanimonas protaetiae TaxID=2509457 RepID=A0A4P6F1F2_9MICO|nr:cation:proton antiporter [Xylanimonas protaetiae]QAY69294.1 cation:proton antiporter [Xylanimonas protaetiae]